MTTSGIRASFGAMKPKEFAQRLGETFAVIQHGMDLGAEWALKKVAKMQEEQQREEKQLRAELAAATGENPTAEPPEAAQPSFVSRGLQGAKTFFQMLTDIGETYYKRYGEIKKDTAQAHPKP